MSTALNFTELRSGSAIDLPAVSEVMADAFEPRFGEGWTSSQCMGMLSLPGVWLTLAYREGGLVGFALARAIAGDGELLLIAVRPSWRGCGVGAALLRSVIADAEMRAAERLHLEVRADNRAIRLYLGNGFLKVGERRGYYRGCEGRLYDAHTYARQLT
jgi:ribosomal-protein-alanine N-acetyltransferase